MTIITPGRREVLYPSSSVPECSGVLLGSLFGGLLRSAMPIIKGGAVALGKEALKTGVPNDASRT